MADIDPVKIPFEGDFDDVKKGLDDDIPKAAKKSGEEAGKSFGSSFGKALKALAGLEVVRRIASAFGEAIDKAVEFERQFIALDAAARNLGKSQDEVRQRVLQLAEDGSVSLETLSQNFRVLLSLGKGVDESFQILDAAKRVGVLNTTISGPDGVNEALRGFVKFLATGEAELADNLDPTLKGVAKSLGGYTKVADDAATQQKFLNAVIEKGAALQGDYNQFVNSGAGLTKQLGIQTDRLSATIGSILLDALEPVLLVLVDLVKGFREFLETLSGTAQKVTILGGAFAVFAASTTLLLGPVGLIIAGITAAVVGLTVAIDKLVVTNDELVKSAKKSADEFVKLNRQFGKNKKIKEDIVDLNGELARSARALQVSLRGENGELLTNAQVLERVRDAKIAGLRADREKLVEQRRQVQQQLGSLVVRGADPTDLPVISPQLRRGAQRQIKAGNEELRKRILAFDQLLSQVKSIDAQIDKILNPPAPKAAGGLRRGLEEKKKVRRQEAQLERSTALIRFDIEVDLINKERKARLDALEILKAQELKAAGDNAKKRAEIEEKFAREKLRINAESEAEVFNLALSNAEKIASGVGQITQGGTGALRGIGAVGGAAFGPQVQAIFNNFAGIADTVSQIFGKGEDLQAQLEARVDLQNTITELTREEEELSRKLTENARQRSRFITEDLQRQLRINRLLIEDEETRRQADIAAIRPLLEERAGLIGVPSTQPQAVADFIGERVRQELATSTALGVVKGVVDQFANVAGAGGVITAEDIQAPTPIGNEKRESAIRSLRDILAQPDLPTSVRSSVSGLLSQMTAFDQIVDAAPPPSDFTVAAATQRRESLILAQQIAGGGTFAQLFGREGFTFAGDIQGVLNTLKRDLDNSNDVLDLLEQIQGLESQSTQTSLDLIRAREQSLIDIGRGGVRDVFGVFRAPAAVNLANLALPGGVQQVALAQQATKSFSERQADALETLVLLNSQQLEALVRILDQVSKDPSEFTTGEIDSFITSVEESISERTIAA